MDITINLKHIVEGQPKYIKIISGYKYFNNIDKQTDGIILSTKPGGAVFISLLEMNELSNIFRSIKESNG